jgi:hypothetical protein
VHNLTPQVKTVVLSGAVAAGTTAINGTAVDTQGYSGVRFIVVAGALTATQVTSLKAQQSDDDGATDAYSDLEGSLTGPFADADAGKALVLEIHRPQKRYVRPVINRATANAAIACVICELFNASHVPADQDATVVDQTIVNSPDEGTA